MQGLDCGFFPFVGFDTGSTATAGPTPNSCCLIKFEHICDRTKVYTRKSEWSSLRQESPQVSLHYTWIRYHGRISVVGTKLAQTGSTQLLRGRWGPLLFGVGPVLSTFLSTVRRNSLFFPFSSLGRPNRNCFQQGCQRYSQVFEVKIDLTTSSTVPLFHHPSISGWSNQLPVSKLLVSDQIYSMKLFLKIWPKNQKPTLPNSLVLVSVFRLHSAVSFKSSGWKLSHSESFLWSHWLWREDQPTKSDFFSLNIFYFPKLMLTNVLDWRKWYCILSNKRRLWWNCGVLEAERHNSCSISCRLINQSILCQTEFSMLYYLWIYLRIAKPSRSNG